MNNLDTLSNLKVGDEGKIHNFTNDSIAVRDEEAKSIVLELLNVDLD